MYIHMVFLIFIPLCIYIYICNIYIYILIFIVLSRSSATLDGALFGVTRQHHYCLGSLASITVHCSIFLASIVLGLGSLARICHCTPLPRDRLCVRLDMRPLWFDMVRPWVLACDMKRPLRFDMVRPLHVNSDGTNSRVSLTQVWHSIIICKVYIA